METVTLYSTWPTLESAETAARTLVERRLAACANILPRARSVFRWQGEVQTEDEVVMIAKTIAARAREARDLVLALHPYDVPCLTVLPIQAEGSNPAFIAWIAEETSSLG